MTYSMQKEVKKGLSKYVAASISNNSVGKKHNFQSQFMKKQPRGTLVNSDSKEHQFEKS